MDEVVIEKFGTIRENEEGGLEINGFILTGVDLNELPQRVLLRKVIQRLQAVHDEYPINYTKESHE